MTTGTLLYEGKAKKIFTTGQSGSSRAVFQGRCDGVQRAEARNHRREGRHQQQGLRAALSAAWSRRGCRHILSSD